MNGSYRPEHRSGHPAAPRNAAYLAENTTLSPEIVAPTS